MRQGQQNRRGRGRGRKVQNPLSRSLESNGPDVKIRGTAAHIAEKYATLARDALAAGDNVAGESYLQHAEHYNRIIMASQAQHSDSANGSGQGRGRSNGSGEPEEKAKPETSGSDGEEGVAADEGVARTISRSVKRSRNGADDGNDGEQDDRDDTAESSDEAVT